MTGTLDEVESYFEGDLVATPSGGPWGWMNDGLPIIPPTEERVARMLRGTSHSPDEVIRFGGGFAGPAYKVTVEKVAINAVMAGCKPEYMPVVLAIAETRPCVGGASDSSMGYLYVLSGPIAKEIGMNSGFDLFDSGNPANMSLQRAAQLMGLNLGHRTNGVTNLQRTGCLHWGTIFAESPDTPWMPLNVMYPVTTEPFSFVGVQQPEESYGKGDPKSSVLLSWRGKVQIIPFQNLEVKNAANLEECQAGTPAHAVAALKTPTQSYGCILMFTPDTARLWKEKYPDIAGTMESLQNYIWDNCTWRAGDWYQNYWFVTHHHADRMISKNPPGSRMLNPDMLDLPPDTQIPMYMNPHTVTIIVAGGTGPAWTWGVTGDPAGWEPSVISIDKWR